MKKILITAGPTREYLDPVRYLSNDSSGRMGFALAGAAVRQGYSVTLVAGPVALKTPKGVKRIDVVSARGMHKAVMKEARRADAIIMAAAVSDWRPLREARQKMKRVTVRSSDRLIALVENPDVLASLGKRKRPGQILVGFALETNDLEKNAIKKLKAKNCDWIVANAASAIGSKRISAVLMNRNGNKIKFLHLSKGNIARLILSHTLNHL